MFFLNCFICIVLAICVVLSLYLALNRNKKIKIKGRDDYFSVAIILFACILAFPINNINSVIEIVRTILLYTFLFSTFTVKRGLNQDGINKIFFCVKWKDVERIEIGSFQTSKFYLNGYTKNYKIKLIFNNIQLKAVLRCLNENHSENIKIEKSLQNSLAK